jgi:signal transduction histidine kinase
MATGGVLSGGDPPGTAEMLHVTERTRVTRLVLPGRTAVRKELLGPDADRRLRRERATLGRLRGLPGVAQLLEEPRYPNSITLVDAGGSSLAEVATPLDAGVVVGLGLALARAVAGMHRAGVLHRDISPANIVVSRDGVPCLVGFGLATSLAEIRPEFTHHTEIVGTLAYLAPEQTGRTGRAVDRRADLYALGAMLYELATGAPPFGSGDPLRLTHDHLARVPTPPTQAEPAVPAALSEIILHLLEKEPDRRYQSADGLAHDLEELTAAPGRTLRVAEHDVPLRLQAPSRLVGRDAEVTGLTAAFAEALAGSCRGVLVGGAPGVGKTALVDELRSVVTDAGGWFVAGKFDQYRRDLDFDAVNQVMRALGRLLLAEPEDELARIRDRILAAVGANAAQLTATVPEFATVLRVPPDPGDPLTAQARAQRTAAQILRAVASRERPLVVFVDDLQWAGRTPLGTVDLLFGEEPVGGLLVVGAFRDGDPDLTRPLAAPLARWRDQAGVRHVLLDNLPTPDLAAMVAEMVHTDPTAAAALVEAIEPRTRGNPYETVELLDALRRDGMLTPAAGGWRWDPAEVRAALSRSAPGPVAGPAAGRVEALPAPSRRLLETMACLGGRAEPSLLQTATGEPAEVVEQRLAPALDEGLLTLEPGTRPAVRFRHDRIREAILGRLAPSGLRQLRLAVARRLAPVPELFAVAAEQYLPVAGGVDDPVERRDVVGLLRRAAEQAALIGDHTLIEALLAAALRLVDPADTGTVVELRTGRHAALFSQGRLEEADEEYLAIEGLRPGVLDRSAATAVQVRSLSHRTRFAEAIELGLRSLRECGIAVPDSGRFGDELGERFGRLSAWLDTDPADDLARPELADPVMLAASQLIDAVIPAGYFVADPPMIAWLALEGLRIWIEHGPSRTLLGPMSHAAYNAGPQGGDFRAGYRGLQRIVAFGEARGYEPATSQTRFQFGAICCWFEPLENAVRAVHQAREGLIAGDNLAYAGYCYQLSVPDLVDCAPTLASFAAEVEGGLAFLRRTGNEQTGEWLESYRWLVAVLRGESTTATRGAVPLDRYATGPLALLYAHICHGTVAALTDDAPGLAEHSTAAMALIPAAAGSYSVATVRLLNGLALAERARAAEGEERGETLRGLDETAAWFAARAVNAPVNFLHLLRLVEAERAWAVGDFRATVLAFDAALREVAQRRRPWHRALIAERAARFYLAHGVEQAGHDLLAQAREAYVAWGATGKVAQLDWAYPTLRPEVDRAAGVPAGQPVTTGTLDLLGILGASQALSSETSLERLRSRVVEVLSAMTGATGVQLVLGREDGQDWLPGSGAAGPDPAVPMSVLRYVQRVREPLVVDDVSRDDRFARDPYFSGVTGCSLLALPVLGRGSLRAVLLLENRLLRGAFTAERLDAVKLIAAQLTVSLDNAQLYAELTESRARIVTAADQTRRRIERDLHDGAQQRLANLAIQARMAQNAVPPGGGDLAARLDALATEANRAMRELSELARGIHPAVLADGGLRPALRALARRSPVPVDVRVRVEGRLPEQVETATYFAVAEALTNTTKHAQATAITVDVDATGGVLRVRVSDDGHGGAAFGGGSGLLGLKDRVEALGGRFSVRTAPDAGTTVHADLPLSPPGTGRG